MSRHVNEGSGGTGIATCECGAATKDAELMARLQAGGDVLGALLRRYARLVQRVAADILRDAGEAEDVTQEVFLEIYRKAHLYDPSRGSVRVWLLQYAYHRSLRRKDALRRRAAWKGESLETLETRPMGRSSRIASGRIGVDLTRDECRWVIRAGLEQLPPRQRLTLELACLEGLSLMDVAGRLGVSHGCARHYYYRGLARLKAWAGRVRLAGQPVSARYTQAKVRPNDNPA